MTGCAGIGYALSSGYLLVNRYWYEFLGQRGYDILVRTSGLARDPKQFWTSIYTRPFLRMVAYPFALRSASLARNR